jgi:hypothetical protein
MPDVSLLRVRPLLVLASAVATALVSLSLPAPLLAARAPMVSVQPLEGRNGERVRREVARVVRGRRFRVVTEVPKASGTGQYYTWARELGLTAFVVGELQSLGRRQRVTFLVWSGHDGSVVGRWTVTAASEKLPTTVARHFWRRLGPALRRARAPGEWRDPGPGPTIRIDASSRQDDDIVGVDVRRRRL